MKPDANTIASWFNVNLVNLPNMKTLPEINENKLPPVTIDPSLNKYRDQTLFPQKLALAKKQLQGVTFPPKHDAANENPKNK